MCQSLRSVATHSRRIESGECAPFHILSSKKRKDSTFDRRPRRREPCWCPLPRLPPSSGAHRQDTLRLVLRAPRPFWQNVEEHDLRHDRPAAASCTSQAGIIPPFGILSASAATAFPVLLAQRRLEPSPLKPRPTNASPPFCSCRALHSEMPTKRSFRLGSLRTTNDEGLPLGSIPLKKQSVKI